MAVLEEIKNVIKIEKPKNVNIFNNHIIIRDKILITINYNNLL